MTTQAALTLPKVAKGPGQVGNQSQGVGEAKDKGRIRRLGPLLKLWTLLRPKHKRPRPGIKRLFPRPKTSLLPSRAKRKTPPPKAKK